jgi:hypothetical protein
MEGDTGMHNALVTALDTNDANKLAAWLNAAPTANPNVKTDCDGRMIWWNEYGLYSEHGWQIDHATPLARGGSDLPSNLRARHWRGNSYAGGLLGMLTG